MVSCAGVFIDSWQYIIWTHAVWRVGRKLAKHPLRPGEATGRESFLMNGIAGIFLGVGGPNDRAAASGHGDKFVQHAMQADDGGGFALVEVAADISCLVEPAR